jgi:hypothetical protein
MPRPHPGTEKSRRKREITEMVVPPNDAPAEKDARRAYAV